MRALLFGVNVVGGIAVLGSYAHGILTHPGSSGAVWGGVPEGLKPWYVASMLLAAAGYFGFTYFIAFALDPNRVQLGDRLGFGAFVGLYALVLIASSLWMPLTFAMLDAPTQPLWLLIRADLFAVAIGSLGILVALFLAQPNPGGWTFWVAVAGALAFCVQTVLLDALVWPAYFPA